MCPGSQRVRGATRHTPSLGACARVVPVAWGLAPANCMGHNAIRCTALQLTALPSWLCCKPATVATAHSCCTRSLCWEALGQPGATNAEVLRLRFNVLPAGRTGSGLWGRLRRLPGNGHPRDHDHDQRSRARRRWIPGASRCRRTESDRDGRNPSNPGPRRRQSHHLLARFASNCTVAGDNPHTIDVPGGLTVAASFAVTCAPTTGSAFAQRSKNLPSRQFPAHY